LPPRISLPTPCPSATLPPKKYTLFVVVVI
jgi:hypothetical protein